MKKKLLSIGLVIVLTAITFYIVFKSSDIETFPKLIHILNPYFLLMAIGCMIIYIFLNAMIIYYISKEITDNISFKRALYLAFIGQYYSAITPFAGGGQPVQIMVLKSKYDVSLMKGTTITVKKFIIYQTAVSILSIVMYFYSFNFIHQHYAPTTIIFIVIGILCNFVLAAAIIMLAYTDVYIKGILNTLLKLAHKFKLFKKMTSEDINAHLDEYVRNIGEIKKNKKTMLGLFFLTFVQLILYFSVTYFIYLALNQKGARYIDIVSVQVLVYMVASFIPTPGNAGASEGGFYAILHPFFNTKLIIYAMAIWRVITYYGVMIVSGLALMLVKLYESLKQDINRL